MRMVRIEEGQEKEERKNKRWAIGRKRSKAGDAETEVRVRGSKE